MSHLVEGLGDQPRGGWRTHLISHDAKLGTLGGEREMLLRKLVPWMPSTQQVRKIACVVHAAATALSPSSFVRP